MRQREEELRQAHKLEAVGRLAGGIAHDYNNILTVIRGNARSLLLRDGVTDLTRDALEHIDRAAARGSLLTARLLAFSQRQLLQPEMISIGDLVGSLRDELAQLLGPHIRLTLERAPGVDLVNVDRRWMSQVILDLCFNGREAMPFGGALWVRTRVADDELRSGYGVTQVKGPAMVLEIEDSGRGMDEATRGRFVRTVLQHQAIRPGLGARAGQRLWHRAAERGRDHGAKRARARHQGGNISSGGRWAGAGGDRTESRRFDRTDSRG